MASKFTVSKSMGRGVEGGVFRELKRGDVSTKVMNGRVYERASNSANAVLRSALNGQFVSSSGSKGPGSVADRFKTGSK